MSSEKGSEPPWHLGLHLPLCRSHSECCMVVAHRGGCPLPCPASPRLPQELPSDRPWRFPAGAQPSHLEKSPWKRETSVKAAAVLFAVAGARTCPLQDWDMKVTQQPLYFHLQTGQSSGAITVCAVAAHTREQPCGSRLRSGFRSQLCHMFFARPLSSSFNCSVPGLWGCK